MLITSLLGKQNSRGQWLQDLSKPEQTKELADRKTQLMRHDHRVKVRIRDDKHLQETFGNVLECEHTEQLKGALVSTTAFLYADHYRRLTEQGFLRVRVDSRVYDPINNTSDVNNWVDVPADGIIEVSAERAFYLLNPESFGIFCEEVPVEGDELVVPPEPKSVSDLPKPRARRARK
jgi:hypothetical protein